jgi:hypothetical protein
MKRCVIITLYAVAGIVLLGCIKLLLHFTLADTLAAQQGEQQPPAELIRCLVLYGQRMLIVASLSIDWPASIAYPLRVVAWVWSSSSPETLSADCILPADSSVPLAVQRVLFYLCMPIAMLLVLLVFELLLHFNLGQCSRRRIIAASTGTSQKLLPRLGSSAMVVLFFFLPSLHRTLFGLFACIPLDQPAAWPYETNAVGSYWVYDTSSVCFGTTWHKYLAIALGVPLVALLCIGLPAIIVYVTVSNKDRLDDVDFRRNWGFLTHSYSPRFCWWEAAVVLETAILVAISVFGVNVGAFYQCLLMLAALMLISHMQLGFKPYLHPQTRKAMVQSTHCLLLTALAGLSFLPYGPVQASAAYGLAMGGIVLAVNVVFVCSVLWQLLRLIDWPLLCTALNKCTYATSRGLQHICVRAHHARMHCKMLCGAACVSAGRKTAANKAASSGVGIAHSLPVSKHVSSHV